MKTLLISILTIMAIVSGYAQGVVKGDANTKSLIVFFSRSGNTQVVAEKIQSKRGADMFRIEPVKPYPTDYTQCTAVAKQEHEADARPQFKGSVESMADYDVIYLGYPNWWGTMPMVVFSFLEKYDLGGKTIFPFCTNEGSGMGRSEQDIKRLCPRSTVKKGLAIRGGSVANSDNAITQWLNGNK